MRRLALIILDGWGIGEKKENNGIFISKTPFFDSLWEHFPHTKLQASGEYVGLPAGQIGGSEVGHLTIGAGRVLYQDLPRITRSISGIDAETNIKNNPEFIKLIEQAKHKSLHLIGLVSPGGVHSHEDHLFHLLQIFKEQGCKEPLIHFISDGRDVSQTSAIHSANTLIQIIKKLNYGKVVTLSGRYYAMDRDLNWDRTGLATDTIVSAKTGEESHHSDDWAQNLQHTINHNYSHETTDEFIAPTLIDNTYTGMEDDAVVFFFNFRSDRMKQIASKIGEIKPNARIVTMTQYDKSYSFPLLFKKQTVKNTLGEWLSHHEKTQLRTAETEKAPHVTFFFNGGVEVIFDGETRSIAESNKVKHDLAPEMKAREITDNTIEIIKEKKPDFILVNFANPDMVGHTTKVEAIIKGIEKADNELQRLCAILTQEEYICLITSDHGNADIMYDLVTKEPHSAHTMNPVPFIIYDLKDSKNHHLKLDHHHSNGLSKIAGTALELMQIPKPEKDFESLIIKQ